MLLQEAVSLLDGSSSKENTSVVAYNKAIHACGKSQKWQQALQLLRHLQSENVRPSTVTYNSAIGACDKGNQWTRSLRLLQELFEQALLCTEVTYLAVIGASANAAKWQSAFAIFHDLTRTQLECTPVACNAALGSCIAAGLWQQALDLLHGLQSHLMAHWSLLALFWTPHRARFCPFYDLVSYLTVVRDQNGTITRRALLGHLGQRLEADVVTYNAVISTCSRGLKWQLALSTFAAVAELHVRADVITYNSVTGQDYRSYVKTYTYGLFWAPSQVISALAAGACWSEALVLLLDLQSTGLIADSFTFTAAISASQSCNQWQPALAALAYMLILRSWAFFALRVPAPK